MTNEPTLQEEVVVADGFSLYTEVFLPGGELGRPVPAVLMRTPYGTADQRADALARADEGVAVVIQDCRGRFGSGGVFDMGASEASDGAATLRWVADQPWCDGRVATVGLSFCALTQLRASALRPEPLVAQSPIMGPTWWRAMDFREGGAVLLAAATHWLPRQAATDPSTPDDRRESMLLGAFEVEELEDEDDPLAHPVLAALPARRPALVEGSPVFEEIWRRLWADPPQPGWCDDPGPDPGTEPTAPTLVVAGWWDLFLRDSIEAYAHLGGDRSQHRLVIAAAGHGFQPLAELELADPPDAVAGLGSDHRWALEHLGLAQPELQRLAPVTWYEVGSNAWRSSTAWPPPNAVSKILYLQAPAALAEEPPSRGAEVEIISDPHSPVPTRGGSGLLLAPGPRDQVGLTGGARADVASFDTAPLRQPLTLAGPVTAEIWIDCDAADCDLAAKLIEIDESGRAVSMVDGIARARWRHGPEPSFLHLGQPAALWVHLGDIGWHVPAGHRLRLDLAGSNFPKYDRNPQTGRPEGTDTEDDLRIASIEVLTSPSHPSLLTLTILDRDST